MWCKKLSCAVWVWVPMASVGMSTGEQKVFVEMSSRNEHGKGFQSQESGCLVSHVMCEQPAHTRMIYDFYLVSKRSRSLLWPQRICRTPFGRLTDWLTEWVYYLFIWTGIWILPCIHKRFAYVCIKKAKACQVYKQRLREMMHRPIIEGKDREKGEKLI